MFSLQFGEGALVFAPHANDEAARQFMNSTWIPQMDQWMQSMFMPARPMDNMGHWVTGLVAGLVIVLVLVPRFLIKRKPE